MIFLQYEYRRNNSTCQQYLCTRFIVFITYLMTKNEFNSSMLCHVKKLSINAAVSPTVANNDFYPAIAVPSSLSESVLDKNSPP